jgi:hypothetical protein
MREGLKTAAHRVARAIGASPLLWSGVGARLAHLGDLLRRGRRSAVQEAELTLRSAPVFAERRVLGGPFRGMRYPSLQAFGSTLYPKLAGSYECELVPWLERLRNRPYTAIHDIGCAEGYYAVGLALLFPGASVYAYDSDPAAMDACRAMARANGIAERLAIGGALTAADLCRLDPHERGLILCDCEGCEAALFTAVVVRHLEAYDLIIELHDFVDPAISSTLRPRFGASHDVSVVATTPRDPARFPVLRALPALAREVALDELRPGPMEWLLAESRLPR